MIDCNENIMYKQTISMAQNNGCYFFDKLFSLSDFPMMWLQYHITRVQEDVKFSSFESRNNLSFFNFSKFENGKYLLFQLM